MYVNFEVIGLCASPDEQNTTSAPRTANPLAAILEKRRMALPAGGEQRIDRRDGRGEIAIRA